MDLNDIRSLVTLLSFVLFLALVRWAWSARFGHVRSDGYRDPSWTRHTIGSFALQRFGAIGGSSPLEFSMIQSRYGPSSPVTGAYPSGVSTIPIVPPVCRTNTLSLTSCLPPSYPRTPLESTHQAPSVPAVSPPVPVALDNETRQGVTWSRWGWRRVLRGDGRGCPLR